jgi:lysophospholipase L1-like esterase
MLRPILAVVVVFTAAIAHAADESTEEKHDLPSLYIAGDSTAQRGDPDHTGWGKPIADLFDPAKVNVVNRAVGGRSSRTFVTEGRWDKLLADLKPKDYVLIQFGHNDGGPVNDSSRARGSLPGLGDETQEIDNQLTGKHETIHTYGWYMRKMVDEAKAKGAIPILLSITVRNIWKDGKVERGAGGGRYGQWTRDIAKSEKVAFIDLTAITADRYEQIGEEAVKPLFPKDHTHTGEDGAKLNAECVVAGLKALHMNRLNGWLSSAGRAIDPAPQDAIILAHLTKPGNSAAAEDRFAWLNLAEPADPALPSLILIGDSTVRNGHANGDDGQWGWGDALAAYFDPAKINVVNRAVGGTGARTFIAQEFWDKALAMTKPGDIVIMQFGHNDNGARGALRGTGDETEERDVPGGGHETVHTFGWYLRKYIADIRAKQATPVICTLIPRNIWQNGKITRTTNTHADWARDVSKSENVPLLDLYERIAQKYDELGEEKVTPLFADRRVHTTHAGAELNAACVIEALQALPERPVASFLRPHPAANW